MGGTKVKEPVVASEAAVASFAGPLRPIRVAGVALLGPFVADYLAGWPRLGNARENCGAGVDLRIETFGPGVRVTQLAPESITTDYPDLWDGTLGFAGSLIAAYTAQDKSLVCFHAAAAETGRGLVLMIGEATAGKSTLVAHLIQRGLRSFGDDRVVVQLAPAGFDAGFDKGIALDIPHKLRLPLPADAGTGFADFVAARTAERWSDVLRLRLVPGEGAPFGSRSPLAALILLSRTAGADAALETAPAGETVLELVRQSFAPALAADGLVRALAGLAARVPCHRLVYGRSAEAARLIEECFGARVSTGVS